MQPPMTQEVVDNDRNEHTEEDIEMSKLPRSSQPQDAEVHSLSEDPTTPEAVPLMEGEHVTMPPPPTEESFRTTQQEVCQPTDDLKPHHSRTNDAESSSGALADHMEPLIASKPLIVTQPVDDDRVSLLSTNIQATQADDHSDADETTIQSQF